MALRFSASLSSVFSDFDAAQANGLTVDPRGLTSPIPGNIEIAAAPDGYPGFRSTIRPTDAVTFGGIRSEIDYVPEANAERWYVWQTFFPTGFSPAERITFMQVHDSPDAGENPVKFPNFEFMTQAGTVFCQVPFNAPSEATSNGRSPTGYVVPAVTGRWVTCCLHTNWATDATGFLEVWYDGKLVAREWGRACGYTDAVGPYWKLGLYDFDHGGIASTYQAWYRNASLYDTGHCFAEVTGMDAALPAATLVAD